MADRGTALVELVLVLPLLCFIWQRNLLFWVLPADKHRTKCFSLGGCFPACKGKEYEQLACFFTRKGSSAKPRALDSETRG